MATVTGYTAERMQQIENTTVVDGDIVGDDLILLQRNGTPINAGSVRGPQGLQGVPGSAAVQLVTNSTIPSSPALGQVIFNTDTGTESFWNGTVWVQAIPSGLLMPAALAAAPLGWLICDGAAVSRTTYALLFAAIATTYGVGNGTSTFNVPNLKGRMPIGLDSADGTMDSLGDAGGEKTHVLTSAEMPAHTHVQNAHSHQSEQYPFETSGFTGIKTSVQLQGLNTTTNHILPATAINQNTGGGAAHNNLPPFVTFNFVIKT